MTRHHSATFASLILTGALIWVVAGCAGTQQTDKIPITTSSTEALNYYVHGRDLSEKLQEQESIAYFKKAIGADPNFAMAYLELALVEPTRKGFFEQLDRAMDLKDRVTEGERLQILAVRAIADSDPTKQIKLYEELVEKYPLDERAHNLLAIALYSQEDYERAIVAYERAIEIAPEFSQPYNQLGYAHKYLGNYTEAQNAFRHYIELIPDDPNPYDSYAELLLKNHEGARNQLRELYRIARDDGERREALFAMAVSYVDEGNLKAAHAELEKMYWIAENIADASAMSADLTLMGRCLFESEMYDQARSKFESARALILVSDLSEEIKDNAKLRYLFNTAMVDMKRQHFELAYSKADAYLEAATAKDNALQIRRAHELAAMVALEEGDYDESLARLEQASQLNPYNHFLMAKVYEAKGDVEMARKCCLTAAGFNALNDLNYAFIRNRASQRLAAL
jgi:tetratricopeptide (TPR) repeat protein